MAADPLLRRWATRPPSYEASQVFLQGVDVLQAGDNEAAVTRFHEAYRLDSTFLLPLLSLTGAYFNLRRQSEIDSILRILESRSDELTRQDRLWVDVFRGRLQGDHRRYLLPLRELFEIDPTWVGYLLANAAVLAGRPELALEGLAAVDPEDPMWGASASWIWIRRAQAYHQTGQYEDALEVAQNGRRRRPDFLLLREAEIAALVALGRMEEIGPLLDHLAAMEPDGVGDPGMVFLRVAGALARFGHLAMARTVAERALDWYRMRDPEAYGLDRARALLQADRPEEALPLLRSLGQTDLGNLDVNGLLGIALARTGDEDGALAQTTWFENLGRPFLLGTDKYWRAAILANLDRNEEATRLLGQAFVEGRFYLGGLIDISTDPNFMLLWGYEPFEQVIAPKG
jgi:tetratricopeptide (TPR) repeat protein